MKKTLLCAFALLLGGTAFSQDMNDSHFQIGVRAGLNVAGWSGKDSEGARWDNRYAGHAGVIFSLPLTFKSLAFQPEILYSMKGAKNDVLGEDIDVTQHHIDVPLLLVYRVRFVYFELGPQASVLLKANTSFMDEDEDTTDDMNRLGIGAAAGVGVQLANGLSLGVRYNGDFNRLIKESDTPGVKQPDYRNSVFQVTLGYLIGGRPGYSDYLRNVEGGPGTPGTNTSPVRDR